MSNHPRVIPELDVTDLTVSLSFYAGVLGFSVLYERPEERFAMLDLDGARIMLEEAAGPGRRFRTAALERPFGRGLNLQIEVEDAGTLYRKVTAAGVDCLIPSEERWYRTGRVTRGNQQFVLEDPDGYLLRFFTDFGERALGHKAAAAGSPDAPD